MKIWVDADACPKAVKEILFRAAERTKVSVVFVANQRLTLPSSDFLNLIHVEQGADVADGEIVERCERGDLVITADIPLAARAVEKGALALNPRGKLYNQDNIKEVLGVRNFLDTLRGSGVETGGPGSFSKKDQQLFANELDKFIFQWFSKNKAKG